MKSLRLVGFLLESSRATLLGLLAAGAFAGLVSAALLALITHVLAHREHGSQALFAAFAALVLGKVVATAGAQLLIARFSQGTILELSLRLARKLLDAPLRTLEQRGGGNILATLTDDVSSVTWAVQCLPQLAMNGAVLLGCAAYLAWLAWQVFAVVAIATLLGAAVYKLQHDRAFAIIHAAREQRSRLFELFRGLTLGLKELMMHRARREQFMDGELRGAADAYRASNLAATSRYAVGDAWVQLIHHALIALVLFGMPLVARPSTEALTGYVFAMLYLMTPVWNIIGTLPAVARGQAALAKIEALGISLDADAARAGARALAPAAAPSASIELRGASFRYETSPATPAPFALGPIDLRLQPGELLFVVGGNGSGKSTFVKLLAGLYAPHAGSVLLDGTPVTDATRAAYRERFSVVFSDFHLFDTLLGLQRDGLGAAAQRHLRELQLDHKVGLRDGRLSTLELSQGQRKRLALLTAYLEDRPVCVFDEWAADQDPAYKRVFYETLLPELRARGKAVVVITHDDRYFHLGDRLLALEDGRVAKLGAP